MNRKSKVEVEVDTTVNGLEDVERMTDALSEIPPQVVIRNCRDCDIHINPNQTVYIPMTYKFMEDKE